MAKYEPLKLGELKAKLAEISSGEWRSSPYWPYNGKHMIYAPMLIVADNLSPVCADGIVAVHDAAGLLIEVAAAALDVRDLEGELRRAVDALPGSMDDLRGIRERLYAARERYERALIRIAP